MALEFFSIDKGLELDDGVIVLSGTGVPGGTTDTDNAPLGSLYMQEDAGGDSLQVHQKHTTGSGTDKWSALADKTYVDTQTSSVLKDFKESVRVATDAALPAYTPAGSGIGKTITADAVGVVTIDGEDITAANGWSVGDRILVKDEGSGTDVDNGIYTVTTLSAAGAALVLTRATDADEDAEVTAGMFVFTEEGTANKERGWILVTNDTITVDTTALTFSQFSGVDAVDELGFIRSFVGKTGSGSETPTYTSNNILVDTDNLEVSLGNLDQEIGWQNIFMGKSAGNNTPDYSSNVYVTDGNSLETAIGDLDAALADAHTQINQTNVTTEITADSVNVDTVAAVRWTIHAQGNAEANAENKNVMEVLATHDGHNTGAGDDATDSDYNRHSKLKMGNITGYTVTVDVNGAGGSQVMRLRVSSTMAADLRIIREIINF